MSKLTLSQKNCLTTKLDIISSIVHDAAAVAAFDEHGQFHFINDQFCEMLNWEIESLKSAGLSALLSPKYHDEVLKRIKVKEPWVGCFPFSTPAGSVKELNFKYHKFVTKGVRFGFFVLRKESRELAVKEDQNRILSSISSNLKGGVYRTNKNGDIIYVNREMLELFGFESEDEALRLKAEDFYVDPEQREKLGEILQSKSFVKNMEVLFRKKSGEVFWGLVSTTRTSSFEGQTLYDGVVTDISSMKEMERLLRSEKQKALAASKSKQEFLSIVSHELKTPLNAVVGMANVLLENDPRKDQLEGLNVLVFSANNLLSLINDILDFSKIQSGKIELELRKTNLRTLLQNIVKGFEGMLSSKAVELNLCIAHEVPEMVVLDTGRLSQILNNLIGNACKFTFHGEISVGVSVKNTSDKNAVLLFEVVDTGVGIPEQKRAQIFESFSQGSSAITREFGGTGLGLTISEELVDLMGGQLEVNSEVGFGSKFFFEITLDVPVEDVSPAVHAQEDSDFLKLKGARVLAVEDNEVNQVLLKRYANMWGIEMTLMQNGLEALEILESERTFDVVLMDIQMPVMDGYTSAENIRRNTKLLDLPIIAVTATSTDDVRLKVFSSGMNDFVSKPYSPDVLKKVIAKHLS